MYIYIICISTSFSVYNIINIWVIVFNMYLLMINVIYYVLCYFITNQIFRNQIDIIIYLKQINFVDFYLKFLWMFILKKWYVVKPKNNLISWNMYENKREFSQLLLTLLMEIPRKTCLLTFHILFKIFSYTQEARDFLLNCCRECLYLVRTVKISMKSRMFRFY